MDGLAQKHHGVYDHRIIDGIHLIPAQVTHAKNETWHKQTKTIITVYDFKVKTYLSRKK